MSKKRQRCAGINLENKFSIRQSLQTFIVIVSNNYSRISSEMGFTIEDGDDDLFIYTKFLLYTVLSDNFNDKSCRVRFLNEL
jgi:hypothetical protein